MTRVVLRRTDAFNSAPRDVVVRDLLACCDVPAWADSIADGRPYPDSAALLEAADRASRRLSPTEVDRALAAHPRIGERPRGAGTEAAWSRHEQSGVDRDPATAAALADGNRAYEERFERVFLVCASGLSAEQVLAALRERLGHDDETEAAVVADELRKIALLRLGRLLDGPASSHRAGDGSGRGTDAHGEDR